jgi:lysophospholipase L1-like esterase
MYYALFYNRALSAGEIYQNNALIQQIMANRGLVTTQGNTFTTTNQLIAEGDSITAGSFAPSFLSAIVLNGSWNILSPSWNGQTMATIESTGSLSEDPYFASNAPANALIIWAGTNDSGSDPGSMQAVWDNMAAYAVARRKAGFKVFVATMLSRTGLDAKKNTYNALIRANWQTVADGLIDIAANPNLGCDGCNSNTTYFQGDNIHPTPFSQYNLIAPVFQRAINRFYGNRDFSTATTYTTGAAAATATTAGSESTNTVTITFGTTPANCLQGSTVTIAGATPSGYNGTFNILTRSGTQITYFDSNTGLGNITVQGTGVCPLQVDADTYAILGGSATSPSFTLESCVGYTGQNIYLKNANTTSAWVLTPFGSETIDGAASLTMPTASSGNNPVVILQSVLVSASAGGCNWKRVQ